MRVAMFLGYVPEFGRMWVEAAQRVANVIEIRQVTDPSPDTRACRSKYLFERTYERGAANVVEYEILVKRRSPEQLWGIMTQRINARRITDSLREIERHNGPIDVVHGHFYSSVVDASRTNWPVVFTEHSSLFGRIAVRSGMNPSEKRSLAAATAVYERASRAIAISAQQQELISRVIPGTETDLIHNPVTIPSGMCGERMPEIGRLLIVTLGRLGRTKRHDVMLDAVGRLRDEGQNLRPEVFGVGDLECELQARVARLGLDHVVRFRGRADRGIAMNVVRSADALLTTSDVESFGLPNVEALLSGTPICSTPVGVAAEMSTIDGAEISDEVTADAVADALRRLFSRQAAVSDADHAWLQERVGAAAVASKLVKLYEDVA